MSSSHIPINHSALALAAQTYPPTKPIYMLNLWKYRATADYTPHLPSNSSPTLDTSPCTGREALARYRASIQSVLPPNTTVHFLGTVAALVVAPKGEQWDDAVIVKYEDLEAFRKMVGSEVYEREAQPHRLAGLEDSRLIMLEEV
ncbi:hypothetical protein K458DRAFT_348825, partial [Lentithecium fluviatile CBS 122367]